MDGSYVNPQRGYPSTTYETRRSAFLQQAHESATKSGNVKPTGLVNVGRVNWTSKYLTYGQS